MPATTPQSQEAQRALRESESRYRSLFDSIDEGFCVVEMIFDSQGKPTDYRFLETNPSFEKQTGLKDARGKTMRELAPGHEEHWFEMYGRIAMTGEAARFQNRAEQLNRTFDVYAFRFGDAESRHVAILFNDITERERARGELDHFFSLSLDFLCISSFDGYFKRVSPGVTDMLGWSVEEFLGRPFIDFVHPDDHAATLREVDRQVLTGEKVWHFENRYRHKDGSWRVLSWRSVPHGGRMYATARDVTKAREAQEQIRSLNRELQERAAELETANSDLEAFSYSVSHDLRAPLRHVMGFADLLAQEMNGRLSETEQRYLDTIGEAGRNMGRLIEDLLAFSLTGRSEMHHSSVDLDALVRRAREELEVATNGRNITWKCAALPRAQGDATMLMQVFANLIGNAVKYSRGRDPAEIEVGCAGTDGGRMILFVRDNGAGFDMKYADRLFKVFQRLHRSSEFEGSGIGLANVYRIISRHGGRIWAEGVLNAGATFYFTLNPAAGESKA